jgi:hypothetical protein
MPITASTKMSGLQARWLADTIRLWNETATTDVDAATGLPTVTESDVWTGAALCRQDLTGRNQGSGRVYGERVLVIKVDMSATPQTNMRVRIVECRDSTLDAAEGTVVDVDRDAIRAVRRITVRLDNSQ